MLQLWTVSPEAKGSLWSINQIMPPTHLIGKQTLFKIIKLKEKLYMIFKIYSNPSRKVSLNRVKLQTAGTNYEITL